MKIVNISGGLGNQMFQYAFAIALKKEHPDEEVYVDVQHYNSLFFHHYKGSKGINLHNGYEIDKLFPKANIPKANPWQLVKLSYWIPNYVLSRIARKILPKRRTEYIPPYSMNYTFDKEAFYKKESCYYEGFWQSIHHFDNIRKELRIVFEHGTPDSYNKDLIENIKAENSVGIHVRRGDYLAESEFSGICGLSYYSKAIDEVRRVNNDLSFYVFSDDIEWCKKHLSPLFGESKVTFVTENRGKNSCWDMFLMSYCRNLIIANSSFSWWAAYLNKEAKKICVPYPWLTRQCEQDIYDDCWIKINVLSD